MNIDSIILKIKLSFENDNTKLFVGLVVEVALLAIPITYSECVYSIAIEILLRKVGGKFQYLP